MKGEFFLVAAASVALLLTWVTPLANGDEPSNSPYIDSIRKQLPEEIGLGESYTEKKRGQLQPTESSEGYSERLRRENPALAPRAEESFIDSKKAKLDPRIEVGAIEALATGTSKLQPRYEGEIHHAFGLRYGASMNRDITSGASTDFNSLYGANYALDLGLFFEWQPFHSEIYGNFGLVGSMGVGYFNGQGLFSKTLTQPWLGGTTFSTQSRTKFQFFSVPVSVAASYRFNLSHYIRPFVMGGPTLIGYFERRNDSVGETFQGNSRGLFVTGGASILLDWISKQNRWDAYTNSGIHHTYLTIEYSRLSTISGDVTFAVSGINAGLTFEY